MSRLDGRGANIVATALVVGLLGVCGFYGIRWLTRASDTAPPTPNVFQGGPMRKGNPSPGRLGQPLREGLLEVTVTEFTCGHAKIGEGDWIKQAEGQFCVGELSITNIGRQPATFRDFSQALTPDATRYDTDGNAVWYARGGHTWSGDLEPGQNHEDFVVFDIPEDERIVALELHSDLSTHGFLIPIPIPAAA